MRLPGLSEDLERLAGDARSRLVAIRSEAGGGSGTPMRDAHTVVTCNHVVPGDRATVVTADERELTAAVIARDPDHDLATLHIADGGLAPFEPSQRPLRPGELVVATGHPWGQRGFVTAGVVFSTGPATVEGGLTFRDALLADLRLAPGNSGGPMLDAGGRVAGINAMIAGGIAVAVPVAKALALLGESEAPRGVLGLVARPIELPAAMAASYPAAAGAGLMVTEVAPGSPAEAAGLLPGDLLLGLDGDPGDVPAISRRLQRLRAGRRVRLDLLRGGRPATLEVTPEVA